ncbi:MAG: glycosyl hydrolase 2 galactose-binding domain-containing protein [Crocinitomicaceae bacterium]
MRYWVVFSFLCAFTALRAQNISKQLDWYFIYPKTGDTVQVGSKGSVQHSLWKNGFLPDPFVDSNDQLYAPLEEQEWTFRSNFDGAPFLGKKNVVLDLSGIDTYAEVLVNGDPVLITANAFVDYQSEISSSLVSGKNEIEIRLTPPVLYHREAYEGEGYHLPSPNDNHRISAASRVRKPQFQFGWDWTSRMNTIGINGGVILTGFDELEIYNPTVFAMLDDSDLGKVRYSFKYSGDSSSQLTFRSRLFGKLKYNTNEEFFVCNAEKDSPHLWSPVGEGNQNLYTDQINIYNSQNQVIKSFLVKFGFKSSELVQEKDEWGESYYFKINGKRVFAKGANAIPADVFLSEIEPAEEAALVKEMARSNFNMVRVWGGGAYSSEAFLNACDSLGIMVWHDLMFACSMYPGDSLFLQNVSTEVRQQLSRILSHPCVVQVNGNNEVDVAWKNWGFQESYGLNNDAQKEIELAYNSLFKQLVSQLMRDFPGVPYTHTSPLSNWGKLSDFNSGSQHYWGLWHGNDELSQAFEKIGRFNSEYGFQSFPTLKLLQAYSSTELNEINSPELRYKQRSYVGNNKIIEKVEPLYGPVTGLEDLIYKSQLYQADVLETYIMAHRRNALRCGGTLYWQLNDVFPGPTWSTIDYQGNYKAAHYKVQKCFEEVAVTWINDSLYISNLGQDTVDLQLNYEWLDLKGRVKEVGLIRESVVPFNSATIELIPLKRSGLKKDRVLRITYSTGVPEMLVAVYVRKMNPGIIEGHVSISEVEYTNDSEGIIELEVADFSEKTWVQCELEDVQFIKNFENLLPGKHRFPFRYTTIPELKDFHIYGN